MFLRSQFQRLFAHLDYDYNIVTWYTYGRKATFSNAEGLIVLSVMCEIFMCSNYPDTQMCGFNSG